MQKCTNRSAPLEKALHLKENVMPKPDLLESKCILSQMYDYHETKCRTLNNFFQFGNVCFQGTRINIK